MNVQLRLEELEDRSAPTAAELAAFQQQQLPMLKAQFHAVVPIVQTTLQSELNRLEALTPLLPAAYQPLLSAVFSLEQQFVNAFPSLAKAWFQQAVANFEAQLLAASPQPAAAPFFFPGFFPYFYGNGFPGVASVYGGAGFTSGFSSGASGSSGGSSWGNGDPPTLTGRGMGAGLMSMAGALTLASNSHS
ncbi:MAG: hypothetical protein ACYC3I_11650 [Gemmataceae bacterium]